MSPKNKNSKNKRKKLFFKKNKFSFEKENKIFLFPKKVFFSKKKKASKLIDRFKKRTLSVLPTKKHW
jgi:hypothetical protein